MRDIRTFNKKKIIQKLISNKKWDNQFSFLEESKNVQPSWFGLPMLINRRYINKKNLFLDYLLRNNIESRPIISGNFVNQKSVKLFNLNPTNKTFKNTQEIDDLGFFIGLHTKKINDSDLNYLTKKLLSI